MRYMQRHTVARLYYVFAVGLAFALLAPLSARAQSDVATLTALRACRSIGANRARLACFDDALAHEQGRAGSAGAAPARDASSAVPTPSPAARTASTAARTASTAAPRASSREDTNDSRGDVPEKVVIVEVRNLARGKWVFVSSEGREFVQTTSNSRLRVPEVPFDAMLEAGALGSLFLASADLPRLRVSERER